MSIRRKSSGVRFASIEALEGRRMLSADLAPSIALSSIPPSVVGGAKVHGAVKVELTNASAATVKDKATVALYLSADGTIDDTAALVTSVMHGVNIKDGHASTVNVPVHSLPASLEDGTYTLVAAGNRYIGQCRDNHRPVDRRGGAFRFDLGVELCRQAGNPQAGQIGEPRGFGDE